MWFSFGFPVDTRIQAIVDQVPAACWAPAIESNGEIRDGAWVAEITGLLNLSTWPEGSKVFLRKERPHPGAQLSFTDADGMRITAFITDIGDRVIPGQAAGLELNHRQHARVEDRIREAKNAGLRNLPCRGFAENAAWLETLLTATDLVCWAKLLGRSPPSATSCCTSPPASPQQPAPSGSASIRPGAGQQKSPKPGWPSAPPSPNQHPVQRPERTRSSQHQQVGDIPTSTHPNIQPKINSAHPKINTSPDERRGLSPPASRQLRQPSRQLRQPSRQLGHPAFDKHPPGLTTRPRG